MTDTVLILGGTGRFGRHMAEAFWNAGWQVRLFDRATDDVMQAAKGADIIVHGLNPAYPDWQSQMPQLTERVIAAAKASGAAVILPGNLYVFGQGAPDMLGPDTPHAAQNLLGQLKIEMERRFREAGVQTLLLRAGDFLDTEASGNWFDRMMAPSLAKGRLTYPGIPDAPHAWAYLPDLARAAVQLAERRHSLPKFLDLPFPGYTLTGHQLAATCAEALQRDIRVKRMNWLPLRLAAPFWRLGRHLLEMRYLWNMPHALDPDPMQAVLPEFKPTPLTEAITASIAPVLTPPTPDQPKSIDAGQHPQPAG